jgi:uncharacterized membrane protein YhhN
MTSLSIIFLVLAAMFAVLDWIAVARDRTVLEYVSKPAATAALLGTAVTLDVARGAPWGWLLAALVLCILGDVFLMLPRDAFVPGLASFALAQAFFTVSFVVGGTSTVGWMIGLAVAVPLAAVLARRHIGALRRQGHVELVVPVAVYVVVISAMAVAAVAGGSPLAVAGAAMFLLSDSLIAESRFVRARAWHPVGIMVTYHLALAGLVFGLL